MVGPIPTKVIGEYRKVKTADTRSLDCRKRFHVSLREEVEDRIFGVWDKYQAELSALQASPPRAELFAAVAENRADIGRMIALLADPLPKLRAKPSASDIGQRNYQFQSSVAQLLEVRGISLQAYKSAAVKALEAVRGFDAVAYSIRRD